MSQFPLAAPVSGWLMNLQEVPDPVFSEGMMGIGIAIDPTDGRILAPCAGKVLLVAPTRHSITIRSDAGAELLIHVGLETVALAGRGFETLVREGDPVAAGDLLIRFDLDSVGLEAKSLVTPVLLTNAGEFRFTANAVDRLVRAGDPIGSIEDSERTGTGTGRRGEGELHRTEATVVFEHGLHARPAARLADCAKRFSSEVIIALGSRSASARSPVALMALNAQKGDRVLLNATGPDGADALAAIGDLLNSSEEGYAATVAAPQAGRKLADNEIAGVCALPGIAIGTARHWRREVSEVRERGRGVEIERTALEDALAKVRTRLRAFSVEMSGPAKTIADAHIGLLDDEQLSRTAFEQIASGASAAKAWQVATSAAADALRSVENPRLRERIADLEDICAQVVSELAGEAVSSPPEVSADSVLIADELLPSEMLALPRERIAGLATARGGATSHMAIIAASFGIPTLVAMGPQVSGVPEGVRVLLDATSGVLVIDPDEEAQSRATALKRELLEDGGECRTRDGERVRLLANLGGLRDVEQALQAGAEGCGLLRTEFLFLERLDAPSLEEQRSAYQAIADALGARPLTIRTLDIGGDKPVPYIKFPEEQNPALGARGIRTELFNPDLLEQQLRAIGQVRSDGLKVMIPMVSSVAELHAVRKQVENLAGNLRIGVMVETPAAALIADRLAHEADFLSIGSNDLAQYVLAMDRTNPLLASSIDALHPAVLELIARTSRAGQQASKTVSLCGGLASDPVAALVLVGLGIRELSAVPAALPVVRHALAQVSAANCRTLAASALRLETAAQVRALAAELLNDSGEKR